MNPKNYLLSHAKEIRHTLISKNIRQQFIFKDVPYFSQWESRELNAKILSHEIDTKNDPKWKLSGASTQQEYEDWSWTGCGMACTKMLIAHKTGKVIPIVELGKKCAEYSGYTYPLKDSAGLRYAPYVKFMKAEFGLEAKLVVPLIIQEIVAELSAGNYVIVSVSPDIRTPKTRPTYKGGHLILMLGYDLDKKELYFHNPSGTSKSTQEYACVSFDDFKKFFSGRGIIIKT